MKEGRGGREVDLLLFPVIILFYNFLNVLLPLEICCVHFCTGNTFWLLTSKFVSGCPSVMLTKWFMEMVLL